ncbi:13466_t:CDS:2, partial [Racocetra fulgida]
VAVQFKALEALIEAGAARSRLCCSQLLKELSNMSANDLTYDNPLASSIICDESELVKNLPQDCQEEFGELELVNIETGRPESDWKKQLSDHNKLARSAKDAFEDFSINE